MSSDVLNSGTLAPADREAPVCAPAIGLLAEADFAVAQTEILGLDGYSDYEDWLDSRSGRHMGLAMAGVDATIVEVGLAGFRDWCALVRAAPDEDALDAFAALALRARTSPSPRVMATLDDFPISRRRSEIARVTGGLGLRRWAQRRDRMRAALGSAGVRFEALPVRIDNFLAWCACVDEPPSESSLDCYAQLLLEHLTLH